VKRQISRAARAGIYPLLGAALLTPAAVALGLLVVTELTLARLLVLWAVCVPASVLLAMSPLMQRLEVAALSELLDVDVPARADRVYLVVLASLHLFGGATLSAVVLALSPAFVRLGTLWREAPGELIQVLLIVTATLAAMVAAGFGQRWAARRLLRGEPSRVIDELGRRQTLALELHDAVGHALSVVLVQAMAASTALQRNGPALAVQSLDHLTAAAHRAQQDLDVLLSVLDDSTTAEGATLEALDTLTRGLDVHVSVHHLDKIPPVTSRAVFALAREAITNAVRHGLGPVVLDITAGSDVMLTVDNATAGGSGEVGRGLTGMRLRARLAGGTCTWEQSDGTWRVQARLPL
jgi:signal transduction histidine kinase